MANFTEKYNTAKSFIFKDIWTMDLNRMPKSKRWFYNAVRVLVITAKGFVDDGCGVRASALTYFSLLSVVPVLALAFAIAKGFGLDSIVEELIHNGLASSPDTADYLISFSSHMLENTRGGIIAGIGVVMLLYSVFKLLSNIEESFNHMWYVEKSRTLLRKVTDYVTIMIFAPILLMIASSVTVFLKTQASVYFHDNIGQFIFWLFKLAPYVLMVLAFTFLYLIMPNTKVDVRSAVISGAVIGVIFQVWQWIFVTFQVGANEYGAVYGSFAALPLFLIWLQTSWMIVLVGCELSYSIQNVHLYATERSIDSMSPKLQKRVALLVMTSIVKDFASGKPAKTALEWSDELKISQRMFLFISGKLQKVGLLAEIKSDSADSHVFIPAMDISMISVNTICDRLDNIGDDEAFPISMSKELAHIDAICKTAEQEVLGSLGKRILKDL